MAQIPNDQKFHTLSANTPTVERGSAQADALREIYTMQDIIDSVSFGSGVASLDGLTGVVNLSGAGAVTVSNNGSDTITITGDAGVETLNTLVGGVTLVGGAGVTIADNGSDTITITFTGGGVSSLETLTGALNLVGAGTVAVTDNGSDTITITGSGGGSTTGEDLSLNVRSNPYSAAGDHEGTVLSLGTLGLTVGTVYHWNGTEWADANAGAVGTADGLMGIATDTGVSPDVLVTGIIQLASVPGAVGDPLYLDTTNGLLTATAPSGSGDIVRVMGYKLDTNRVYFNPSGDFFEIA